MKLKIDKITGKITGKTTCKTKTCDKPITYERETVLGLMSHDSVKSMIHGKVVYLTCEDGHTHPYTIEED